MNAGAQNAPSDRADLLTRVAERLASRRLDHPLRVGIDGVCGSGKTTFARDLAARIGARAIDIDSDGFHHVRAVRYRQGRESARGYYEDAYDLDALRELVLLPLGPGGSLRYAEHVHDLATDEVLWLDVPEAVATARGVARDAAALGGAEAAEAAYASRYMAACRLYLDEEAPRDRASIVLDHTDPERPGLMRW